MNVEIAPALLKYIATRDKRHAKYDSMGRTDWMLETFKELHEKGSVRVGGRASCGGKVDPTWMTFTLWNEIVRKAQDLGHRIDVVSIKHPNKSPTMAGGFWNENEYTVRA